MNVERALFLSRWEGSLPDGYQRLYFGAEFCSWAFPPLSHVDQALAGCRIAGLGFTLVTPVLRESSLKELKSLFRRLQPLLTPEDEVVISDFGAFELVRQELPQVTVILGRALSGQKRGPRIEGLPLEPEALDYFRQGSWYAAEAVKLLQELGIDRVELDNLLQGLNPLPKLLRGSLHTPYALVTSSRNCPFHGDKTGQRCAVGCGEAFQLSTDQTAHPLLQAGNSQFLKIDQLPDGLSALGIDRLVYHPRIPR